MQPSDGPARRFTLRALEKVSFRFPVGQIWETNFCALGVLGSSSSGALPGVISAALVLVVQDIP